MTPDRYRNLAAAGRGRGAMSERVHYFRDGLGRRWMAEGPCALFRVRAETQPERKQHEQE